MSNDFTIYSLRLQRRHNQMLQYLSEVTQRRRCDVVRWLLVREYQHVTGQKQPDAVLPDLGEHDDDTS